MKRLWFIMAILLFVAAGCATSPVSTSSPTSTAAAPTETPTAAPTVAGGLVFSPGKVAPDGLPRQVYYAPFSIDIALDGDLSDWDSVPTVTIPADADLSSGVPAMTFAAAAKDGTLYLMADVIDSNIVSGEHETNYWNEDSVEFYINGTGNLTLNSYTTGVAQITIPPLNIGVAPEEAVFGGIHGDEVGATAWVFETETGYAIEMAVPLKNDAWSINMTHGNLIGFQAHLNGGSSSGRDTKLIWSAADQSDTSYQNPSVFGQLVFFETGQTDIPEPTPTPTPIPTATPIPVEPDAVFLNPEAPVEDRVEDLLARMTLAEKIGQMTLVEKNSIKDLDLIDLRIGGLLSGGGGYPDNNTPEDWAAMVDGYQQIAMQTPLSIPLIYGVDAVHGHNNVRGAVIFPHNIGLGAANDPELMTRIGRATAEEMIATGIYWNYAPVVAVPQDIRWGRTYEAYSENTNLVTQLATAYLRGLQGENLADPANVLGTPKHYVGDGGTVWGSSTTGNYKLDQGVTEVDEATLRTVHLPPYVDAIEAGARNIMVSFSSWGGIKMHGQKYLVTDVLKGELGFTGFVVSDWGGIDQINPDDYDASVVTSIDAGIDMNMVPYNYERFIETLTAAVESGDVSQERIDDAVRRILRVKFEMGLFEHPYSDPDLLELVGSEEHRAVAREAVSKSLVLLQNDNDALPLDRATPHILVAGTADDIGFQSGGWTIEWQGVMGDITPGTTILSAIGATVGPDTVITVDPRAEFEEIAESDLPIPTCIAVIGEKPYAEGIGDRSTLVLLSADVGLLRRLNENCETVVTILIAGRPMIITNQLQHTDAFVMAWLPGTEGQGIADVLFGDVPFTGTLPFTWPRSMEQVQTGNKTNPLFPLGFGLKYDD